jgi:chromosome partitioning protein
MPTIAIANQKGGVGKTTTTVTLAAALTRKRKRVLCVDLDPQAGLTLSCVAPERTPTETIYSVLIHPEKLAGAIAPSEEGFDVVVGSQHLAAAELELASRQDRASRLATLLRGDSHDYVLIDCPPSLGLLSINALVAARYVLVPVATEYLALQGLALLVDTIERTKALNPALELLGILPTMMDRRTLHSREVLDVLQKRFPGEVFQPVYRTVRFNEAPLLRRSIISYAPRSQGAKSYTHLAKEVIRHARG